MNRRTFEKPAGLAALGTGSHGHLTAERLDMAQGMVRSKKTGDLGAAGWPFDEICHHAGVLYSFAKDHGHAAPGYIYNGDMPMTREFHSGSDPVDPDFIFAGEWPMDWMMQYYQVSYFRIDLGSRPVDRYIDAQAALVVAVSGFNDRDKLNLILASRYFISYEPFNFKGHLSDFPLTLAYGKQIDALRRRYREFLWDAEFHDTLGATLTANSQYRYSIFVAKSGKRAVVVVNLERTRQTPLGSSCRMRGSLWLFRRKIQSRNRASRNATVPARPAIVFIEQ
jgi:hypothetical protein